MGVSITVQKVTFSDGSSIDLNEGDLLIIVGPNNSGKSRALKGIAAGIEGIDGSPVIQKVGVMKTGTASELVEHYRKLGRTQQYSGAEQFLTKANAICSGLQLKHDWDSNTLKGCSRAIFYNLVTTEERLQRCGPIVSIKYSTMALTHPIHIVARDDSFEFKISNYFREAFGMDLVVHRFAGSEIPLFCGQRPQPPQGKDRASIEYCRAVESMDPIHEQGDGIRAYVGIILEVVTGMRPVVLLDEPEAFLHPPQARLLGRVIAQDAPPSTQTMVATHSGDFLKGVLDAGSSRTRVVRLSRQGNVNQVTELKAADIAELWRNPLLRYSNVLDGLFHEGVILCEADGDCLLYGALLDEDQRNREKKNRDLLFLHCGGKDRMPVVINALVRVGVPIATIVDFDILNSESTLKRIVESYGGNWDVIRAKWKPVAHGINSKEAERSTEEVTREIAKILEGIASTPTFPKAEAKKIAKICNRASSQWPHAKEQGLAFLKGQDYRNGAELLNELAKLQIHVVPVGELECFFRAADVHGPNFVTGVLADNMHQSQEAEPARQFIRRVVDTLLPSSNSVSATTAVQDSTLNS